MTVNEAIEQLTQLRNEGHGELPLAMVDENAVVSFALQSECNCVYVSDIAPGGDRADKWWRWCEDAAAAASAAS
jgi:hypothetical protein